MQPNELERLNKRLGDLRGRNPKGESVYRWFHSRNLLYPCRNAEGNYEQLRQVDDDCYLLAMWQPPMLEHVWRAQFPDIGYPANGIYYATDVILRPGVEPNDARTDEVSGYIKNAELRTFRSCLDEIENARAKRKASEASTISDIVDDATTAFGNVPGARGGEVSFGGV